MDRSGIVRIFAYIALVVHVLFLFPILTLGLVAPGWAVLVFLALWLGLLIVAVRLLRRRPGVVILVPMVLAALVYGVLTVGDQLLGWTA